MRLPRPGPRCAVAGREWVRRAVERALEPPEERNPLDALAKLGGPTADIDDMLCEVNNDRHQAYATSDAEFDNVHSIRRIELP